jgi:flagellar protein FlaG
MIMEIPKLEGLPSQPKPRPAQQVHAATRVAHKEAPSSVSSAGVSSPGAKPQAGAQSLERAQAENLAQDLQKLAQQLHRELNFRVDGDTGKVVIRVIDAATEEVLRQIPSESALALQQKLAELQDVGGGADAPTMNGLLFKANT